MLNCAPSKLPGGGWVGQPQFSAQPSCPYMGNCETQAQAPPQFMPSAHQQSFLPQVCPQHSNRQSQNFNAAPQPNYYPQNYATQAPQNYASQAYANPGYSNTLQQQNYASPQQQQPQNVNAPAGPKAAQANQPPPMPQEAEAMLSNIKTYGFPYSPTGSPDNVAFIDPQSFASQNGNAGLNRPPSGQYQQQSNQQQANQRHLHQRQPYDPCPYLTSPQNQMAAQPKSPQNPSQSNAAAHEYEPHLPPPTLGHVCSHTKANAVGDGEFYYDNWIEPYPHIRGGTLNEIMPVLVDKIERKDGMQGRRSGSCGSPARGWLIGPPNTSKKVPPSTRKPYFNR